MLRVTVTTFDRPAIIQDPRPIDTTGRVSYTIAPNTTENLDISWPHLERIAPQLEALADQGFIYFTIESSSDAVFAQQPDNPGVPVIDFVSKNSPTQAGDTMDVTGPNLDGGEMATAQIDSDDETAYITLFALPGSDGNSYSVEVIDEGAGGLDVSLAVVDGRNVITINLGDSATETVETIKTAINDSGSPVYGSVYAEVTGTTTKEVTTVRALVDFSGGTGVGFTVTLAGIACIVTGIDVSVPEAVVVSLATPNYSALSLATGTPMNLQIRANGKVTTITVSAA